MKKTVFSLFLVLCMLLSSLSVYAAGFSEGVGKDEIPYGDSDPAIQQYGFSEFEMMTAEEAAAKGVPAGYTGYVLALTNSSAVGIMLNRSADKILVNAIERITFRVWCTANTREVRITDNKGSGWIMRAVPSAKEEWIEISLTADGENFCDGYTMARLADENGYLKPVNFGFRFSDSANTTVYVDSITVEMKAPDTTAPVITYEGETVIETREGRAFSVDATAFDEYEGRTVEIGYLWSEGAVDENGLPLAGRHTCTLQATDLAGNKAELVLTVNVEERDVTAPTITRLPDRIEAVTGSHFLLTVTARDDVDEVTPILTWSEGALDTKGRLTAGTHTLTVTVTDLTGNKAEKTVTVSVSDTLAVTGTLIQDTPHS